MCVCGGGGGGGGGGNFNYVGGHRRVSGMAPFFVNGFCQNIFYTPFSKFKYMKDTYTVTLD